MDNEGFCVAHIGEMTGQFHPVDKIPPGLETAPNPEG
jgi:hypothetical protein